MQADGMDYHPFLGLSHEVDGDIHLDRYNLAYQFQFHRIEALVLVLGEENYRIVVPNLETLYNLVK